jgi:hypothetical protein
LIGTIRQKSWHTSLHASFFPRKQVCSHAHTEALGYFNSPLQGWILAISRL